MAYFAEYGFNKSHSAAYAYVTYQTAYLKAHYPVEFMAATLSADMDNTDKIVKSIAGCREMGIEILPPDINLSGKEFKVVGSSIRFGLEAVKGVGAAAIESIIETRNTDGLFTSVSSFLERIDQRKVNKKVVEGLIKAGAFDALESTRAHAMETMNRLLSAGSRSSGGRIFGQQSIFGDSDGEVADAVSEWNKEELLKYEKESLGFYITGHPLTKYYPYMKQVGTKMIAELEETDDGKEVMVAGIITAIRKIQTKMKAETMAYCTLEDPEANVDVIVFPELYKASISILQKDIPVLVKGSVDKTEKGIKIVANEISRLDAVETRQVRKAELTLRLPLSDGVQLQTLRSILKTDSRGFYPLYLRIMLRDTETLIETGMKISGNEEIVSRIEAIAGKGAVVFQ
jgi:DNA polymerase-3 subunit alpha